MSDRILFWHRRDLRLHDNLGLAAAYERTTCVTGVFCLDPALLEGKSVAPARVTYMIGCLSELQDRYGEIGGELLILKGNPETQFPALAKALKVTAVYWNRDVEPYSRDRDTRVAAALKAEQIEIKTQFWDQLLHAPGDVLTGAGSPYTVYGPFWRNWHNQAKAPPAETPSELIGLSADELEYATSAGVIPLPTAPDLGFSWENPLPLAPGEQAALERLEDFCSDDRQIGDYDTQRNFPEHTGTSGLSAALKFGVIGIRTVWLATVVAGDRSGSDEVRQGIQTWRQELAWREFYQHVLYFFPELADGPYRAHWKNFPWVNDRDQFQAWCQGLTGYPLVDAAMRQLNQTGWMHNRCRMVVASFLTKDLIIDWRWGEQYFMKTLVDGDLAANNGGWQWSASSGMDPKPLRIFNPTSQAKKFDPEAAYIRRWLPEISHLDTAALVMGKIPAREGNLVGYPQPIVDHKQQQAQFKALYKAQKS